MNWAHLHLALNHIPVLGVAFVALLLVIGWVRKSHELMRVSLWLFVILTAAAIPIKFTGDYAYEAVQGAEWLDASRAAAHETAADQATTGIFLVGIAAALGLFLARKGKTTPRWAYGLVLILALVTSVLMGRAANLGGELRHPEIRSD